MRNFLEILRIWKLKYYLALSWIYAKYYLSLLWIWIKYQIVKKLWNWIRYDIMYYVETLLAVLIGTVGVVVTIFMGLLCIIGLPLRVQWARTLLFFVWILQEYFKWVSEDENILDKYFEENRLFYDTLKMIAEGRGM